MKRRNRTEQEVRARIAEIVSDERMDYPNATVHENAPLALIQLEGQVAVQTLRWVLGELERCAGSYATETKKRRT